MSDRQIGGFVCSDEEGRGRFPAPLRIPAETRFEERRCQSGLGFANPPHQRRGAHRRWDAPPSARFEVILEERAPPPPGTERGGTARSPERLPDSDSVPLRRWGDVLGCDITSLVSH